MSKSFNAGILFTLSDIISKRSASEQQCNDHSLVTMEQNLHNCQKVDFKSVLSTDSTLCLPDQRNQST